MSTIQIKRFGPSWPVSRWVFAAYTRQVQNGFLAFSDLTQKFRGKHCPFRLASLALFLAAGTLRAQLPVPTAWLTFDEGTGTVAHDSSGNGFNATLLGGAGWTTGNNQQFALNVPGTVGSYADIPADVVPTTQSFTVAAWVNLNSLAGYETFVSEDGGFQAAFFLQKRGDSNTFTFTMPTGTVSGGGTTFIADSGITPVTGTWYHIAGVYDANAHSLAVYVNGLLSGLST